MTAKEINAGAKAFRDFVNAAGYGSFVSDEMCQSVAVGIIQAAEVARESEKPKE